VADQVIIAGHDPAWLEQGSVLAESVRAALAPLALYVEHIGSTSIPGMAAKPVFDLQVSVADLDEAERVFDRPLSLLGFGLKPYRQDHVPAGRDDPPDQWVKRFWSRRGHAEPDVNLHVRLLGSPNERLALLFRDWFRAHPEAIPGYARFKKSLADVVPDLRTYSEVKDDVVDVIIAVAESWASETGWAPHTKPAR
jgi:GrpB-like predicted nucleotidyltransferase (UPF0157 family)